MNMEAGMISGTTKSGFEFTVNENIAGDWRLAKALAKSQSKKETEQIQGAIEIVKIVLGDQEEDLCEYLADENGSVPTQKVMEEIAEIMEVISGKSKEIKN